MKNTATSSHESSSVASASAWRVLLVCLFAICGSCRHTEQEKIIKAAEPFRPTNVYPIERLPASFTRVAILPCHYPDEDSPLLDYLDDILYAELAKRRLFEPVQLSRDEMKRLFGVRQVSASGHLPAEFLSRVRRETNADGVLFIDALSYRPYRPLSLGLRGKLVDVKRGEFMWAIEEVFDTGDATVIAAAGEFQRQSQVTTISARTTGSVLASPRNFAKYVAATTFATLPKR